VTRQDFLNEFYLKLDKIASLALPGFEPAEIAVIASDVQEQLILDKYSSKNNDGFEQTEKRTAELGELVTNAILSPLTYNPLLNVNNGVFVDLPNDYPTNVFWLPIYEEVTINKKCDNNFIKLPVKETTHVELNQLKKDPFNKPTIKNDLVFRLRYSDHKHELVTDGTFNVTSYQLRYIKKPQDINLTTNLTAQVSELSDFVHPEILDKTVEEILKVLGDPRIQLMQKQE